MAYFTPEEIAEILQAVNSANGHTVYIGARYIPLFGRRGESSIEWDNSAPYEPLTVVTYQGMSYTSRQYVPTGVAITNTDFWAATGNYDSQVEQYRDEVRRYQATVDGFANCIPASSFDDTNTVKSYIDNKVVQLNNNINNAVNDINNTIDHLTDEIFVLVGDSYSEGYIPTGSHVDSDGWIYKLKGLVSSTHPNVSFVNGSYEGSQMSAGLITQTKNLIGALSAAQKAKVTKILIAGGYNDARHHAGISTFDTNFRDLATYVKNNCKNADVYISFVGGTVTGQTAGIYATTTSADCFVAYLWAKQTAEKYGFIFDEGSYATLIRASWFYDDNVHPNPSGNETIARRMFKFLFNGQGYFPGLANSDNIPITATNGGTLEEDAFFIANFGSDGYMKDVSLAGTAGTWIRINYDTARTMSFNTGASNPILSCPIPAVAGIRTKIPVEVIVQCTKSNTTKWYHGTGIISYATAVATLYLNSCIFDNGSPLNQVETHKIYLMPITTHTYPVTAYPQ